MLQTSEEEEEERQNMSYNIGTEPVELRNSKIEMLDR